MLSLLHWREQPRVDYVFVPKHYTEADWTEMARKVNAIDGIRPYQSSSHFMPAPAGVPLRHHARPRFGHRLKAPSSMGTPVH